MENQFQLQQEKNFSIVWQENTNKLENSDYGLNSL
jgi:hypothetical protein